MSDRGYCIIDEPAPSALSRLAVIPFWIILAGMLLSHWQALAIVWFVVNGFALNSTTKVMEICWAAGALVLALAMPGPLQETLTATIGAGAFITCWPYLRIVIIAMLLAAMYRLFLYQQGSYQLFCYLKEARS